MQDALLAHLWWDKGQLAEHVGGQSTSPWLRLYVDTFTGAQAELELEREKERERERRNADRK